MTLLASSWALLDPWACTPAMALEAVARELEELVLVCPCLGLVAIVVEVLDHVHAICFWAHCHLSVCPCGAVEIELFGEEIRLANFDPTVDLVPNPVHSDRLALVCADGHRIDR